MSASRKLCECGCGEPTKIAQRTDPVKGWVKGQPLRFAGRGHNATVTNHPHRVVTEDDWIEEQRGFDTPCWIWQDRREAWDGHRLVMLNKKRVSVHRAVYELLVGPIPAGHHLHHRCEQPACVNPEHLEVVTPSAHVFLHRKLTSDDVLRIRASASEDDARLADELGITLKYLRRVRRGFHWSHL